MGANRANFRGLLADHDVTAVGALPNGIAFGREDHAALDTFEQLQITSFVLFFDGTDTFEQEGNFFKAFFTSSTIMTAVNKFFM